MQVIDPRELNDLAEFAARGGLGSAVATTDCVAESPDQLMYITGDTLVLLRELEDQDVVIAACEGVVGWIKKGDVEFGLSTGTGTITREGEGERRLGVPDTIISSPTPPTRTIALPPISADTEDGEGGLEVDHPTPDSRRASGPFDLGTPNHSPGLEETKFFENENEVAPPLPVSSTTSSASVPPEPEVAGGEGNRASVLSTASSDALGGIGGFMMGSSADGDGEESFISHGQDEREELKDDSPSGTSVEIETPYDQSFSSTSHFQPQSPAPAPTSNLTPRLPHASLSPGPTRTMNSNVTDARPESSDSWDIYGDYARESMYYKRATRDAKAMSGMDEAFNLAKALRDIPTPPSKIPSRAPQSPSVPEPGQDEEEVLSPSSRRRKGMPLDMSAGIPELKEGSESFSPGGMDGLEGRSVARDLLMKIQQDRERQRVAEAETTSDPAPAPVVPPRSASRSVAAAPITPALFITNAEEPGPEEKGDHEEQVKSERDEVVSARIDTTRQAPVQEANELDVDESENSTVIDTPLATVGDSAARPAELDEQRDAQDEDTMEVKSTNLLASPIPLEITQPKLVDRQETSPQISLDPPTGPDSTGPTTTLSPDPSRYHNPMIELPPRMSPSPDLREPKSPWTPSSPASPHSVTATRQAVQVARSVSESHATPGRGMPTLVGRTDGNLLSSKGPVPITFLVDGAGGYRSAPTPPPPSSAMGPAREGLGLGLPSTSMMGRISPVNSIASSSGLGMAATPRRAATFPLAGNGSPRHPLPPGSADIGMDSSSRFPDTASQESRPRQTYTPVIPPTSPQASNTARMSAIYPNMKKGRSRSFGATMARAMGRGKKDKEKEKEKEPPMPLVIDTNVANGKASLRSAPAMPGPMSMGAMGKDGKPLVIANMAPSPLESTFSQSHDPEFNPRNPPSPSIRSGPASPIVPRKASAPAVFHAAPASSVSAPSSPRVDNPPRSPLTITTSPPPIPLTKTITAPSTDSVTSPRSYPSPTTSTFRSPKPPMARKASNTIPTPSPAAVSHTDFAEETVKADGLDFEIIQPKRNNGLLSPDSPSLQLHSDTEHVGKERPGMSRSDTNKSNVSAASGRSLPLPETDEWGFLKDQSPTPEMFQSRNAANDHRVAEGKWLSIISTPMTADGAPKKVRKLAVESGIPASLRGKVWGWFLVPFTPKKESTTYTSLLDKGGELDEQTDMDINRVYSDHSVFASPYSTGTSDLKALLLAYRASSSSSIATTLPPHLALIAGMLLIHCVAEDAYHLLRGVVDGMMVDYFAGADIGKGLKIDAAVFMGLLAGSEKPMSRKFKEMGIHPRTFLTKWYNQLFIRCLPWPTALRVIDGLLAEGPRFLLIVSLSILTLSRDRIMAFSTPSEVLAYLNDLPQDALLLPENFMKACSEVKFKDEDYKRLRAGVEKEMKA